MDRNDVEAWVAGYERAWRDGDVEAVAALFTEDGSYRESPYEEPHVGHGAIRSFWSVDEGRTFSVDAAVVAIQGDVAVVRLEVRYLTPVAQDYRDLWVLRFAPDGRVAEFEEWPFFPGQPFAADR